MSTDTGFQDLAHTVREIEARREVLNQRKSSRSRCQQPVTAAENRTPAAIAVPMDHIFHRGPGCRSERINVVRLSHAVSRAVFEIIAGYRTVAQLNFVMNPDCIRKLRDQALIETDGYKTAPEPGTSHGQVQSMRLRSTLGGGWECTVILGFKYRVRAVALRVEPWHGRWQVTSVEML